MRQDFLKFANFLHSSFCKICFFLFLILLSAELIIVVLRYVFGIGFLELQGLVSYSFAVLIVLSLPIALRFDRHVRVDILRGSQSTEVARKFDRFGLVFFLVPFCLLVLFYFKADLFYSWSIFEGSRETGGLPGYFLVKTALPISCIMLLIQGLAILLEGKYLNPSDYETNHDGEHHEH